MYNMVDSIPRDETYIRDRVAVDANDCWVWQNARTPNGYGTATRLRARTPVCAHILSYEIFNGAVPDGLQLDHTCFNRACVNPAHLEPVTALENTRRKIAAGRAWNGRSVSDPCKKCGGVREGRFTKANGTTFAWCKPCKSAQARARRKAAKNGS